MYRYSAGPGERLAPIGIALVIEATNERTNAAKVIDHAIEIDIGYGWIRVPNLRAVNPTEFFMVNNCNFKEARRLDFTANIFDLQARDRTLASGESITGWVFLEWPPELRQQLPTIRQFRVMIENSHGEKQTYVLQPPRPEDYGDSSIAGGQFIMLPQPIDLSQVPILPLMDLSQTIQ